MKKHILHHLMTVSRTFPDGDGREIEILFTLLYYSKLYCAFRYMDEEEPENNYMCFSLRNQELLPEAFEPDDRDKLYGILDYIQMDLAYEPGQHFIWLEDQKQVISGQPILISNGRLLFRRIGERIAAIRKGGQG